MSFVVPGVSVTGLIERRLENAFVAGRARDGPTRLRLGPGLVQAADSRDDIVPLRHGRLLFKRPATFWIDPPARRYVAAAGDLVIAVVASKGSEAYRCDLGGAMGATMNALSAFEGTTRKNRPNLAVGAVVLARVLSADRDLEPELVCFDEGGRGDGFGELPAGLLSRVSVAWSQRLQKSGCAAVEALGKLYSFEIVVGANGRFVLNAPSPAETIVLSRFLLDCEKMSVDEQLRAAASLSLRPSQ